MMQLRVHHQDLNPQGRQPIIAANKIANIHFHVKFNEKIVMISWQIRVLTLC